jgi:hypothetical protein
VEERGAFRGEILAAECALQHEDCVAVDAETAVRGPFGVLAWLAVGIPFCIGLIALKQVVALM